MTTLTLPQCLIVAAGTGSRLKTYGPSKPLVDLSGRPIISHVMENAVLGGVSGFVIVVGFMADALKEFASAEALRLGVPITYVHNAEYEKPNGLSVLAAKGVLKETFILSMCDHLMDPAIVKTMVEAPIAEGEVILGIDRGMDNPFIDLDDVTRVKMHGDNIIKIGKGIDDYNAYDTGIFKATIAFFDAIEASGVETSDFSISGGMMRLTLSGKAKGQDIGQRVWIDVDDPAAYLKAEAYLKGDMGR